MKKHLLIVTVFLLATISAYSQIGITLSPTFYIGLPTGDYAINNKGLNIGSGLSAGYNFGGTPLELGLGYSFLLMDADKSNVRPRVYPPFYTATSSSYHSVIKTNLYLKYNFEYDFVKPYVELLGGVNYLSTLVTTTYTDDSGYEKEKTNVALDDWASTFGAGLGLMIPVYSKMPTKENGYSLLQILVNLGGNYMIGSEAEYIRKEDGYIRNDIYYYNTSKSRTDLLYVFAGISIKV